MSMTSLELQFVEFFVYFIRMNIPAMQFHTQKRWKRKAFVPPLNTCENVLEAAFYFSLNICENFPYHMVSEIVEKILFGNIFI